MEPIAATFLRRAVQGWNQRCAYLSCRVLLHDFMMEAGHAWYLTLCAWDFAFGDWEVRQNPRLNGRQLLPCPACRV